MTKDGFSFTVRIEPILGGLAYQSTQLLDDNNVEIATSVFSFSTRNQRWSRTQFNNVGARSTFDGVPSEDGIALELTAFGGRAVERVSSRLLFVPDGPDSYVMDWQSRTGPEEAWQPRSEPFVHHRVERPAPPTGAGRLAFISDRSGNWEVYAVDVDGSNLVNLSDHASGDHAPKWIAGGTRLAFLSQRGGEELGWQRFEVDADGSDLSAIDQSGLGAPASGPFPEVHPSGSYLVYSDEREEGRRLFVSRFDGGGERPLTSSGGPDYAPRWSPDGSTVLFLSERDGNSEIYTIAANGTRLQRLTESPGIDRYACWSPDGEWIAFASDRDTKALELYVMRKDGSDVRRLTENEAEDGEPCWSPDGKHIVFRSNADGDPEICIVEVETGSITAVTQNDAYDGEPVWSPVAE